MEGDRLAVALDPQTFPEHLAELAAESLESARLVAQNPGTPAALLQKLVATLDAEILVGVASNPNTLLPLLLKLGAYLPREVLNNPALPLALLLDPGLATTIPAPTLQAMLRCGEPLPKLFWPEVRHRLSNDGDPWLQVALLDSPWCDRPAIETAWATLPNADAVARARLLLALARNPQTPLEILQEIRALATQTETSDRIWLARQESVLLALAGNPNASADLLEKLRVRATGPFGLRRLEAIACNPNSSLDLLQRLAASARPNVRAAIAVRPEVTDPVLAGNSLTAKNWMDLQVAKDRQTPPDRLAKLVRRRAGPVRLAVVQNHRTPAEALEIAIADERLDFGKARASPEDRLAGVHLVWAAIAHRSDAPADVLAKIVAAGDRFQRLVPGSSEPVSAVAIALQHQNVPPVIRMQHILRTEPISATDLEGDRSFHNKDKWT